MEMFDFIGIIGFLAWIVITVLMVIALIKRNGKAKKWFLYGVGAFIVFAIGVSLAPPSSEVATTEPAEEVKEEVVEKEDKKEKAEEVKKEELTFKIDSAAYNPEKEEFLIVASTNLPEGTEVFLGLLGEENDYDYNGVPDSGVVTEGKVSVVLGDHVDEIDGREYIRNGTFTLDGSFSVNKDFESNKHLFESLGEYDQFIKKYVIDAEVEETDKGYIVENLGSKSVTIDNAYSTEEIAQFKLAKKKETAKTIDFKQLEKNPDRHAGEYVTYTGEIVQIMEGDGNTVIRLALDDWANEILWIEYEGYTDFVEEDTVTIYGEVYGGYTYTSQAGWDITLPGIIADIIE
jgi:hypothetical protein